MLDPAGNWHPSMWRTLPVKHPTRWASRPVLSTVRDHLRSAPALTTAADVRASFDALAAVSAGDAFVVQAGDCAEPFGSELVRGVAGRDRVIGSMATRLSAVLDKPVVTIGRLAGQFAKPRSKPTEVVDGRELPSFRGLIINGPDFEERSRTPDARRMIAGYYNAKAVFHELHRIAHHNASNLLDLPLLVDPTGTHEVDALRHLGEHSSSRPADGSLSSALAGYGTTRRAAAGWQHRGLWTSHEALVLDYEEPLVRRDQVTGQWYLASTHVPWIGERTRDVDSAHVRFLAGLSNPLACKIGPSADVDEVLRLCAVLDPHREPGRLTLILRMGRAKADERIGAIVSAVRDAGHPVVWMCDPMHGNTIATKSGFKTRRLDDIAAEISSFFHHVRAAGQWPGGIHLEMSPDDVGECLDAGAGPDADVSGSSYETLCDPRLNGSQALVINEIVGDLLAG
ncbi:3-deoxy-7-phosphoheptulonate synthase class II [Saccharopolyspora taberi]|uniref:Phospho-2-dehydro-3-deoxyheptonate aldolase n=1 Tax=Saccharopolyspora taberi TaxID=60895 RepID=A0ABN3VHN3_9PSEU